MTLSLSTESIRISSVLQVIALRQEGMKLENALKEAKLTKRQFYYWISKSDETVNTFYDLIQESEKRQLITVLSERETILDKLIEKTQGPAAQVPEIVSALRYMDDLQNKLENKQGVANNAEINAKDYLSGPAIKIQPSRMTATVIFNANDGSVESMTVKSEKQEIIDGEFTNSDELPTDKQLQASNLGDRLDLDLDLKESEIQTE